MRSLLLAVVLCGGAACTEPDDNFMCVINEQCWSMDYLAGKCEATHYCSFVWADCPSGWRYLDHVPDELVMQCVPAPRDAGPP